MAKAADMVSGIQMPDLSELTKGGAGKIGTKQYSDLVTIYFTYFEFTYERGICEKKML